MTKIKLIDSDTKASIQIESFDSERRTFHITEENSKGGTSFLIKEDDLQYIIRNALIKSGYIK